MDDSFIVYLQQLELMAFFSGYPLIYAAVLSVTGNQPSRTSIKGRLAILLPFSYALVGTMYLGLQVRNLFPDYSIENIKHVFQQPYLQIWGLLAILFWIPAVSRRRFLSLLHSLVFFFLIIKDLLVHQFSTIPGDKDVVRNDMKIYTDSLLLNIGSLVIILFISFISTYFRKRARSTK